MRTGVSGRTFKASARVCVLPPLLMTTSPAVSFPPPAAPPAALGPPRPLRRLEQLVPARQHHLLELRDELRAVMPRDGLVEVDQELVAPPGGQLPVPQPVAAPVLLVDGAVGQGVQRREVQPRQLA